MLVTIIARHLCTVNKNAIVLLTLHQKYHGLNFYISAALIQHPCQLCTDGGALFGGYIKRFEREKKGRHRSHNGTCLIVSRRL